MAGSVRRADPTKLEPGDQILGMPGWIVESVHLGGQMVADLPLSTDNRRIWHVHCTNGQHLPKPAGLPVDVVPAQPAAPTDDEYCRGGCGHSVHDVPAHHRSRNNPQVSAWRCPACWSTFLQS